MELVSHKVLALGRVIDKYGAYLNHLTTMSEDKTFKGVDREKLKGYCRRWSDCKIILGCAFFHDLLKPCSVLCKVLQEEKVCVVRAAEALLNVKKNIESQKSTAFEELPTVKKVLYRLKIVPGNDKAVYQEAELKNYNTSLNFFKSKYEEYLKLVQKCLRSRTKVQHIELISHTLTILATHGWEKREDASFGHEALSYITQSFKYLWKKQVLIFLLSWTNGTTWWTMQDVTLI